MKILLLILPGIIYLLFKMYTEYKEKEKINYSKKSIWYLSLFYFFLILKVWIMKNTSLVEILLLSIFIGYMFFNIHTDVEKKDIYSFFHFPVYICGIIYFLNIHNNNYKKLITIIIIALIYQFIIMKKFYALGDCKTMLTCAMFYSYQGIFFEEILLYSSLHILLSLIIFIIINIHRKNITKKFKLKEAQEFIPSIALSVLLFL